MKITELNKDQLSILRAALVMYQGHMTKSLAVQSTLGVSDVPFITRLVLDQEIAGDLLSIIEAELSL